MNGTDRVGSLHVLAHAANLKFDAESLHLPSFVWRTTFFGIAVWQWIGIAVVLLVTYVVGLVISSVLWRIVQRFVSKTENKWDDQLFASTRRPIRWLASLMTFEALLAPLNLPDSAQSAFDRFVSALVVTAVAVLAIRSSRSAATILETRMRAGADPGRARSIATLMMIFHRVVAVAIAVVAAALVLTQYEIARNVGRAMLASAGIATLVAGLAAQKSLGNLLAGLQIAITQPIRVGDTVIVEGEWGWIEEITFSYVVVKVWDLRRLVVPINYFIEKSFQNWTRSSSDIMGTVEIHADYMVPVQRVRDELKRICTGHEKHDGKACSLQVTASTERTVTLRALVSSADAGMNWDLRCDVREGLIEFLKTLEGGRYLPRDRFERSGARESNAA